MLVRSSKTLFPPPRRKFHAPLRLSPPSPVRLLPKDSPSFSLGKLLPSPVPAGVRRRREGPQEKAAQGNSKQASGTWKIPPPAPQRRTNGLGEGVDRVRGTLLLPSRAWQQERAQVCQSRTGLTGKSDASGAHGVMGGDLNRRYRRPLSSLPQRSACVPQGQHFLRGEGTPGAV